VISEDVRAFIRATVNSVWALELLLFLRSHDRRSWSIQELTRELRASPLIVERGLLTFGAAGLISEEPGGVRYAPASDRLDALVREIATVYAKLPLAVSNEIYAADSKIQDFADAFKFRKKDKD
jgi:hypothetical protein